LAWGLFVEGWLLRTRYLSGSLLLPPALACSLLLVTLPAHGIDPYLGSRIDPFGTEANVSPAPNLKWESSLSLPEVKPPPLGRVPAAALSLPELTEMALMNNPRTRQSWAAARAAAASVGIEKSDDLPSVTGNWAIGRSQQVSNTTGTLVPWQTRFGPAISLSYVLFDFGYGDSQVEAAEFRSLAASLSHNRVLQDVVFQVEQAYYLVIGLEALVRVNELSLKNIQTSYEVAQRRRDSGLATVADVYRTETQVAQAQLNLTRSRGDLEKARGQLAVAVGVPVNGTLSIQGFGGAPKIREITASLNNLLDRAKAGRPDLVAAEAQARAARASATAASRQYLPSIEIAAGGGHVIFGDNRQPFSAYNIGLNVKIPIFTGFRSTYSTRAAEAQAEQAEAVRDSLYQQTQLDVWQSYYDLQTAASGIASTDSQVRSAEQTAEATLARYRAGFGSILDLITAQLDESNARVQQIQSYLNWFTALARLNFSIGSSDVLTAATTKP
jgi:outer membrane protein